MGFKEHKLDKEIRELEKKRKNWKMLHPNIPYPSKYNNTNANVDEFEELFA